MSPTLLKLLLRPSGLRDNYVDALVVVVVGPWSPENILDLISTKPMADIGL